MNSYLATFHSHFGALSFCKDLQAKGSNAELKPVPRALSSSCGVCVCFEGNSWESAKQDDYELESIYQKTKKGYQKLYDA